MNDFTLLELDGLLHKTFIRYCCRCIAEDHIISKNFFWLIDYGFHAVPLLPFDLISFVLAILWLILAVEYVHIISDFYAILIYIVWFQNLCILILFISFL